MIWEYEKLVQWTLFTEKIDFCFYNTIFYNFLNTHFQDLKYILYDMKCPIDATFKVNGISNNHFNFQVDAFNFIKVRKSIRLHCKILVCTSNSTSEVHVSFMRNRFIIRPSKAEKLENQRTIFQYQWNFLYWKEKNEENFFKFGAKIFKNRQN